MPTVEVTSTPLTASARLKATLRLTRWFEARGSDPAHVVVVFRTAEPMTYFAGGIPLSRYGDDAEREARSPRWASVVCHIHPDRDQAYMAELAQEVRETLGPPQDLGHCLVRCEPTQPDRVFYLDAGSMTDSSPAPAGKS